jgi:cell division protein FtsI/penicillin-binding protein 2
MASQPNFNPNYYYYYSDNDYRNRAIWELFEPGSTMKAITLAAALEDKAITIYDHFYCPGYVDLYDVFRIHCDKRSGHHDIDPSAVIKFSCNVGAIKIADRLGNGRLYHHFRNFGFGQKTGIQLPGEGRGLFRHPKAWSGLSRAALSIGQEISVNAVQMVRAFSAIVNGGKLYRPKILLKTKSKDGMENAISPMFDRRVVSEKTADTVLKMLESVTHTDGSGKRAAISGYKVAGKTGTAQSLADMHKKTEDLAGETMTKMIASFIGAVPADDPKVVIYVVLNRPKGEKYYGGQIAAPVFKELGQEIMAYMKVAPRKDLVVAKSSKVPSVEQIQRNSVQTGVPDWLNIDSNSQGTPSSVGITQATTAVSASGTETFVIDAPPDWLVLPEDKTGQQDQNEGFMDLLMEEESSVWE